MSGITDAIQQYKAGKLSFSELQQYLVSFPYKVPTYQASKPSSYADRIDNMERHSTLEEGTTGEIDANWARGYLSDDEAEAIAAAIEEHFGTPGHRLDTED